MKRRSFLRGLAASLAIPFLPRALDSGDPICEVAAGGRIAYYPLLKTYSVADFGAKGDGVTDDRAAIHAAIDASVADGGGNVSFPLSHYRISNL